MGSSEDGAQRPGSGRFEKLKVRVNSEKVQPVKSESLIELEGQSEFSQWKQGHREFKEKDLEAPAALVAPQSSRWSQKVRVLLWSLVGLLLAAALFIGIVFYSPLLAVRSIQVEGNSLIPAATVEERLRGLEGVPLTRITDERVAELVGYENILRDVTLEARPPHNLLVQLHERVPVALVEDDGAFVLVDNEGVQLSKVASREDVSLPLIDGGTAILGTGEYQTVTSVLAALPSSLLARVESADAQSPSTIKLKLTDGVEVVWGTAEESELKAKVLTQLMEALEDGVVVETYDVSSPLRPTTK